MLISRIRADEKSPTQFIISNERSTPTVVLFSTASYGFADINHGDMFTDLYTFVNEFFEQLPKKDENEFFLFYYEVKNILNKTTRDNVAEHIKWIKDRVFLLANHTLFEESLFEFCQNHAMLNSSFPDLSKAGTLPHHTEDKTFFKNDFLEITCIATIAKIMAPIWGDLYGLLDKFDFSVEESDEMLLDTVYRFFIMRRYRRSFTKLMNSVVSTVNKHREHFDSKDSVSSTFVLSLANLEDDMFNYINLSNVITQRLIKFDPIGTVENPERNIVKFVVDGQKRATSKLLKDLKHAFVKKKS